VNNETIEITDDLKALDTKKYLFQLNNSYWASKRTDYENQEAIKNSLCFSIILNGNWIGGARIITDISVYSYLCDVIIIPEQRGKGFGKKLIEYIISHPKVMNTRVTLVTKDAHIFYGQSGFVTHPYECMTRAKSSKV
jgi:GNAT superfamily N-acetyltransferase